jgi:hypothetical protein
MTMYSVHVYGDVGGMAANNLTAEAALKFALSLRGTVRLVYVTQGDVIIPFADLEAAPQN